MESSKNWKDPRLIKLDVELVEVPFIVLVVNHHKCRDFRGRRMCKGILCISTKEEEVLLSSKSKKLSLNRMFYTQRVRLSKCMKERSCTFGTITALLSSS